MSTHVLLKQFSILILFFSIENYYNNLFSSSIHDQNSGNNDKSFICIGTYLYIVYFFHLVCVAWQGMGGTWMMWAHFGLNMKPIERIWE